VQGQGELHLSGYFEPNKDEYDEGMMLGDDFGEEDEEEDEEEEAGKGEGKLNKNLK